MRPKDHINIRILQTLLVSGIPLSWALEWKNHRLKPQGEVCVHCRSLARLERKGFVFLPSQRAQYWLKLSSKYS